MAAANIYDLERLAYDVFVRTLSKFGIKTDLPSSRRGENTYEHSNFLDIICNGIIFIQFTMRKEVRPKFQAQFDLHGFKKFHQISNFLDGELGKLSMEDTKNETIRTTISLAFINELILFLYSKNSRLHLLNLAASWRDYVSSFREQFDAEGGFSSFYSKESEQYEIIKPHIDRLIQLHGFQYKGGIVTKFFEKIADPKLKKELKRVERRALEFLTRTAKTRKRSENRQTESSSSLENTGLGIPPHEELLKNLNVPSLDEAASAKRSMSSSAEEVPVASGLNRSPIGSAERSKEPGSSTSSPLSPAGLSKDRYSLTGSPISPAERLKDQGSLAGSPLGLAERLKDLGGLPRSPRSPAERLKEPGSSTSSPLSPAGRSKDRYSLTESPISPAERLKEPRSSTSSPLSPAGLSKDRYSLTGSPISPTEQLKDQGSLAGSPLGLAERSKEPGFSTSSPANPQGRSPCRSSQQTPERSKDRLEQKRQKHLQRKKTEPTD